MKFLKACFLLFVLFRSLNAQAQQTELFVALQTGTPFSVLDNGEPPIFLNFNIGAEQYIIDRLSLSLAFRKPFYMIGSESNLEAKEVFDHNGYNYIYTEQYDSYAIDIESKFFFDGANDDGLYVASALSFQHLTMTVNMLHVAQYNSFPPGNGPALPLGSFTDEMNIYPFSLRLGYRTSGDVIVLDYFFGLALNLGVGGVERLHEQYLDYYRLKTVSFPIGIKTGLKF